MNKWYFYYHHNKLLCYLIFMICFIKYFTHLQIGLLNYFLWKHSFTYLTYQLITIFLLLLRLLLINRLISIRTLILRNLTVILNLFHSKLLFSLNWNTCRSLFQKLYYFSCNNSHWFQKSIRVFKWISLLWLLLIHLIILIIIIYNILKTFWWWLST